ncbi:Putative adhesin [Granulicella rosea]|uniref:Putative adhesin n=1 Tax=Granulicella rosea TaxID=474952 RepID=A0A239H4B6_9BACT|nr:DUF4097 family beta strand repeat-containing protein [Granulicella rosea]SNS76031.1 Putative adhesin [Granulicella rosea]
MTTLRLFAATIALTATTAFAADGHFERTLSVSQGVNLAVSTGSGNIHITPGNDNQIHISAQVKANHGGWMSGGASDIEQRIKQIVANPPIHQSGNSVILDQNHDEALFRNISVDYEIQAPRSTVLHAATGSGDVQVQETGPNDSVSTGSGNIRIVQLHGGATLQSGSGDIQVEAASGGDMKAQTGSGNIRLNGVTGGVNAQTGSGDIQIEGHATSDWRLRTGSGSIRLGLGSDAKFILDADTGSGRIHLSQPITMQGNIARNHVHGSVNGGGVIVKAATGSGDVEIH